MVQLQRLFIAPAQLLGERVCLTAEQQHYLCRVLRLRSGDRFIAINGQGQWWLVALTENLTQGQIVEALSAQTELPIAVTLLMAMPKTGLDDVVRQATELGVGQVVLIRSDRTVLNPSPQKIERWQRIAQEAAEQSERQVVPVITAPQPWSAALQTWNATHAHCYLCAARGNAPHLLNCLQTLRTQNAAAQSPVASIVLAVGPEGGWTEAEITAAVAAGYQPVSLGNRIFRAVTAPIVGLSLITAVLETAAPIV
jgi:16S rRNA (uracil1498-N3)-methyltransferase